MAASMESRIEKIEGPADGSGDAANTPVWQDRVIEFDALDKLLVPRPGESILDKIKYVEDTKGNDGITGILYVTNLRLIWVSSLKLSVNLSIGLRCIVNIKSSNVNSRLKGVTEAVKIFCKYDSNQYEFIFTSIVSDVSNMFSVISSVHRAYFTSKLYREVKLRGAIVENKSLKLLPLEQLYNKINGVMNLSSDQGILGTLYITNIRIAWHANTNFNYTLSLPFIQMKTATIKKSKFGLALVIATMKETAYLIGFRIDPQEKLQAAMQEINRLHAVFSHHPIFGVEIQMSTADFNEAIEEPPQNMERLRQLEDEGNVVVNSGQQVDKIAAYFADINKSRDREPVFCEEIGLAIEKLPDGCTLQELWEVK